MRSINRRRKSNSSDGQCTETGTNERNHSNQARRTAAQVERKRLQDRESQRNVRQRTKNYVASLEKRLAELESPDCTQELLRKNAVLQERLTALEEVLSSISKLAEFRKGSEENATAHKGSGKEYLKPNENLQTPQTETQEAPPSHEDVNLASTAHDTIEVQEPGIATIPCSSDLSDQHPMDPATSPPADDHVSVDVGGPPHRSGSESDETVDNQGFCGMEMEMDLLETSTNYNFDCNMADPAGERDLSAPSVFTTADLDQYVNQFDSQLTRKMNSTYSTPFLQASSNVYASCDVDEIFNSYDSFLSKQNASPKTISGTLSPRLGSFLLNQPDMTYTTTGDSVDQFSLPRPNLDRPSYTVLSQYCAPTNIWDFKLTTYIGQRRSSQYFAPIFSDFDDQGPNVSGFLGLPSSRTTLDPTAMFLAGSINRWKFRMPERLGLFWLHYIYLRYRIEPTLKNAQALPDWFTPRASQCIASHPVWVDTLPWPRLRDKLAFEYLSVSFERFAPYFCASLNLNWEDGEQTTCNFNPDGTRTLTMGFIEHIKKLENWTLTPQFADGFPELRDLVNIKEH